MFKFWHKQVVQVAPQADSESLQSSGYRARDGQEENPVVNLLTRTPVGGAGFGRFLFPEEDGG